MDRLEKFKALNVKQANAEADISLVNQYAIKELTPEDVFCFSVVLCDNEIDRDLERFSDATLQEFTKLFVGKTGISDHRWSADRQVARLYRCEVKDTTEKTSWGGKLKQLIGSAYMIRNEANQPLIDAIEGGIVKEVSIGCRVTECNCSICGKQQKFDWRSWTYQCETGHIKGESYPEGLCTGVLEKPAEAYEFSFVAVPAQRGAGVTKGAEDLDGAVEILLNADLSGRPDIVEKLIPGLKKASMDQEERAKRAEFIKFAETFRR